MKKTHGTCLVTDFEKIEVDLERGESDLGETFLPQILAGYYTPTSAPTEVWLSGSSVKMGFGGGSGFSKKERH